jgi:hypothetical protein
MFAWPARSCSSWTGTPSSAKRESASCRRSCQCRSIFARACRFDATAAGVERADDAVAHLVARGQLHVGIPDVAADDFVAKGAGDAERRRKFVLGKPDMIWYSITETRSFQKSVSRISLSGASITTMVATWLTGPLDRPEHAFSPRPWSSRAIGLTTYRYKGRLATGSGWIAEIRRRPRRMAVLR